MAHESGNKSGLAFAFISVIGAAGMAIAIRGASAEIASPTIAGYRAALMCLFLIVLITVSPKIRRSVQFSEPKLHLLRGFLFAISVQLGFYTITEIPLATAIVLFFTAPIFAAVISVIFKGESIGPRRLVAIFFGFVGALVIIRPGIIPFNLGMLTGLGSSIFFAIGLIIGGNIAKKDGAFSTLISATVITLFVSIPFMMGSWAVPTQSATWMWILILVGVSILRQISDIQAYRLADAALIAPISYLRLVLVAIAAYLIFDEVPDFYTWLGAAIIIGSALYITYREALLKRLSEPSTPLR